MTFDGTEYTIERGVVKHKVSGGWTSECNLPTDSHGGARTLDVVGGKLIVSCADGTEYEKKGSSNGWSRR